MCNIIAISEEMVGIENDTLCVSIRIRTFYCRHNLRIECESDREIPRESLSWGEKECTESEKQHHDKYCVWIDQESQ